MLQWAPQMDQGINSILSNAAPPRTGLPSRTRVGRARGSPRDANWRRAPLSCQKTKASSSALPRGSGVYSGGGGALHLVSIVRMCSPPQGSGGLTARPTAVGAQIRSGFADGRTPAPIKGDPSTPPLDKGRPRGADAGCKWKRSGQEMALLVRSRPAGYMA